MPETEPLPEQLELPEIAAELSVPILSVVVDVNDLLETMDEAEAFDLIGKLKDLLA